MAVASTNDRARITGGDELLVVEDLKKHFPVTRGIVFQKQVASVKAVDGVSFSVRSGETLGVVGESGCGKSTMARCIMRLLDPTGGKVVFNERVITNLSRADMRPIRRELMMIFQDPFASLNTRKRVGFIIAEALEVHKMGTDKENKRRVQELLEVVGLNPEHYNRFPHEFSGGQRQRIGVARALAVNPKLIVCDEPVSALDVSVQAQILNLLKDLQDQFGLTYIFIAHDLNVVRHISDRVLVMYLGKVAETAERDKLYTEPKHPYTGALLSAVPIPNPKLGRARKPIVLQGDVRARSTRRPRATSTRAARGSRKVTAMSRTRRCIRSVRAYCGLPLPARGLAADRGRDAATEWTGRSGSVRAVGRADAGHLRQTMWVAALSRLAGLFLLAAAVTLCGARVRDRPRRRRRAVDLGRLLPDGIVPARRRLLRREPRACALSQGQRGAAFLGLTIRALGVAVGARREHQPLGSLFRPRIRAHSRRRRCRQSLRPGLNLGWRSAAGLTMFWMLRHKRTCDW